MSRLELPQLLQLVLLLLLLLLPLLPFLLWWLPWIVVVRTVVRRVAVVCGILDDELAVVQRQAELKLTLGDFFFSGCWKVTLWSVRTSQSI